VDKIAGFEIVRPIGKGGMGIVYLARDETLQRDLAIKVLRKELIGSEGSERFIREARACSRINHPNIVTVYSAGKHDGDLYIAMELLEGRTLRETIKEEGKIEWRKAVAWTISLLSALQRLHDEGIIHRDLKPENIMVSSQGGVKLMDFGIAHVDSENRITIDTSMLGTAQYMSPEQTTGMKTDARSDIFSLGTILYEMISGELPFDAPHPMAVLYSIANERHKPLDDLIADLPDGLTAIIDRVLEKDPEARFESAGAFSEELVSLAGLSGEGVYGAWKRAPLWRRIAVPAATLAVATVLIAWAFTRGPEKGDRTKAENHTHLGQQYEEENNKPGAQVEYRNAIIADPSWEVPWNNLAMIELSEDDYEDADSLLGEALERNSKSAIALYNMANIRWDRLDLESAESYLRRAIDAETLFMPAYNNLGKLLINTDRPAEAALILDDALSKFDSSHYSDDVKACLLKNRGIAAAEMDDASAETWWRKSLEIMPDNDEIRRLLESVDAL
jgi:serine/threonine-protein kinase